VLVPPNRFIISHPPATAPATHTQLDPRTNPDPHVILQVSGTGGVACPSITVTPHEPQWWWPPRIILTDSPPSLRVGPISRPTLRLRPSQRNTDASPPGGPPPGATGTAHGEAGPRKAAALADWAHPSGRGERALADHVTVHVSRPTHIYNRGSAADHHPLPSSRPLSPSPSPTLASPRRYHYLNPRRRRIGPRGLRRQRAPLAGTS
jgi:hypothetical protein